MKTHLAGQEVRPFQISVYSLDMTTLQDSGVPRGGVWGVQTPPPRNSEDIGGVLDRISKKNRRLDFLL